MNVLKHAKAPAKLSLRRVGDHMEVDVEDEGLGFDPDALAERTGAAGFGLLSVREQISGLGGALTIKSPPGHGTHVRIRVPLQASPPSHHRQPDEERTA